MTAHVGFTGTREGMTVAQKETVVSLLQSNYLTTQIAHHGDCQGADEDFHLLARGLGLKIKGHPPIKGALRAFCIFDECAEPREYITRDHDIVDESDWIIAAPAGFREIVRSGTWATIRYARVRHKPGWIIWPDGRISDIMSKMPDIV